MWKINTACGGSLSEFAFQRPPVQERTINVLTQKRFPDWLRHSRMTRIAILATEDDMPWSNREGIQLRGVPACRRSMDVINVAWLYRLHDTGALTEADEAAAMRNFYVDFGQGVQLKPWSEGLHCLCKGPTL